MVTKDQYEALLAQRSTLTPTLELTPGNAAFSQVGAELDREREDDIAAIERAFIDARRDMQRDHQLARQHGRSRADFNQQMRIKP